MSVTGLLRTAFRSHTGIQLWKPERVSLPTCAATNKSEWNHIFRLSRAYSSLLQVDDYVQFQRLAKEKLREALVSPSRFQSGP